MSGRKSTADLIREAGFEAGEVEASRHVRGRVCNGVATPEDLLAYEPFSAKWSKFAELMGERDRLDQVERLAPDPGRHSDSGDTSLGEALRQHRDGQPPPKVVIRPQMIRVDMGEGGLQDLPEAQPLRMYRGSAGSCSGHERIAADLNSRTKR